MSTVPTPALIKGLFYHLVKLAGGVEAGAAVLGISHQRVSWLQLATNDDIPSVMQIVTLEAFVGQPVVTSALAKIVTGAQAADDLLAEACELTEAAVSFQAAVRKGESPKAIQAAAMRVMREAADLPAALPRV